MPSPGDLFLEIETAKKHGGWPVWQKLGVEDRARLLAHELHVKMREHYEYDVRNPAKPETKKTADNAPWSAMREKFYGGGHNIAE